MTLNGKTKEILYDGRRLLLYNQSCTEWTHPYSYPSPSEENDDLHRAGCGVFATAHMIEFHCGKRISVEELADFSMASGGRGDDGTDRPVLLAAMKRAGRLERYGLTIDDVALQNDREHLWEALQADGKALTDLRPGHIVCLVGCRIRNGERQVLVMDSSRDSLHLAVRESVREVIAGTEISAEYRNNEDVCTGWDTHYGMYWVPLTLPFDFNILERIG